VADITFVPTAAGFLFLAARHRARTDGAQGSLLDAWSRRIVGWAFRHDPKTRLVLDAPDMAHVHCPRTNGGQGPRHRASPKT
jgi:transposase InsO family protein